MSKRKPAGDPAAPPPSDDKIGYRNPPKHSQFKPGQSGNTKGRPSGARSVRTDLEAELYAKVRVTGENGRPVSLTKQQLVVKAMITRAAKGDVRAAAQVFALVAQTYGLSPPSQEVDGGISEDDDAVLEAYFRRRASNDENGEAGDE